MGAQSPVNILLLYGGYRAETGLHPHNPLQEKRQLAALPEAYPYSSARFYYENVDNYDFLTHYME